VSSSTNTPPDPHLDALLAEATWVLSLAKRLAHDQAAAEDIAQSTLVLALEQRPHVQLGLRPWLAKVVSSLTRRTIRSDVRRQDREAQAVRQLGSQPLRGDEVFERFELQQDLARRVAELPDPYRRVLIRRFYEGLSVKEIAQISGASAGTVRSQIARGLERVRLQYPRSSNGHSALGAFLFAAGSSRAAVFGRTAQIVTMQTSIKVAVATIAVIAVAATVIGTGFGDPTDLSSDGSAALVRSDVGPDDMDAELVARDAGEEGGRVGPTAEASGVAGAEATSASIEATAAVSTVRARILGEDMRPLSGASLSSIHPDGRARGTNSVAFSDNSGRVLLRLSDDSVRKWRTDVLDMMFAAGADGRATAFVINQPLLHGDTNLGDIHLGAGGVLLGIVVDIHGRAIPNATLRAGAGVITKDPDTLRVKGPDSDAARVRTMSASDGGFKLSGVEAKDKDQRVRLWAHAPGHYWTLTEPLSITAGGLTDLGRIIIEEVGPEHRLAGFVIKPDGRPASHARVDFFSDGNRQDGHVLTDAAGRFAIIAEGDAPIDIIARDTTEKLGTSEPLTAKRDEIVELRLTPRRVLSVTLTDTGGEPVYDASMMPLALDSSSYTDDEGRLLPGEEWSYTNEVGQVDITIPGGRFNLWVRKAGFGSVKVGPYDYESAPESVTITVPPGFVLTGQVLAYGEAVEGAKVSAMQRHQGFTAMTGGFPNRYPSGVSTVVTDSDGRFVAPLKRGWTEVGVVARLHGLATGEAQLDVSRASGTSEVVIHMTEGGAIEGSVTPPPGMEAAGLYVAASRGDGYPTSTRIDANGRYRFEGLTPGNWRVEGRLLEARTELLSTSQHPEDMQLRWNALVEDRQTLKLDVDMSHLGDVAVHGRLLIDGEIPPSGWKVEAVFPRHARGPTKQEPTELDRKGRFVFSTRPGRVDLRFVGTLFGESEVEMLREVYLEGPQFDWEGTLVTALVNEAVDGGHGQVRFVRGNQSRGDRERSIVPMGEDGLSNARVPVGDSILQVPGAVTRGGQEWEDLRMVEVQ
jgi:RNA polymerase sigma factor (sigma-70 family)